MSEGNELTLDSSIELPGRSLAAGPNLGGAVFAGGDEAPTLTRYDLGADGQLHPGKAVSFQQFGLSSIFAFPSNFQFVPPTRAYYFDGATGQIIVWNPEKMQAEGTVDLEDQLVYGKYQFVFAPDPIWRGNQLVVAVSFYGDDNATYPSHTSVVLLDTKTNEAKLATDDRCPYVASTVKTENGDIYLASEVTSAGVHAIVGDKFASRPALFVFARMKTKSIRTTSSTSTS